MGCSVCRRAPFHSAGCPVLLAKINVVVIVIGLVVGIDLVITLFRWQFTFQLLLAVGCLVASLLVRIALGRSHPKDDQLT